MRNENKNIFKNKDIINPYEKNKNIDAINEELDLKGVLENILLKWCIVINTVVAKSKKIISISYKFFNIINWSTS